MFAENFEDLSSILNVHWHEVFCIKTVNNASSIFREYAKCDSVLLNINKWQIKLGVGNVFSTKDSINDQDTIIKQMAFNSSL